MPIVTRLFMVGPTGCGKTVVIRAYIKARQHVIIIDTKKRWKWPITVNGKTVEDRSPRYSIVCYTYEQVLNKCRELESLPRDNPMYGAPIVFRPDVGSPNFHAECDAVAALAIARGSTTLVYDEVADVVNGSNYEKVAPNFKRAIQQAREDYVSVLMLTQRPKRIPVICGSESDMRFTFYMRNPDDKKCVEEFMGDVPWKMLARNKHSFAFSTDETSQSDAALVPHRLQI